MEKDFTEVFEDVTKLGKKIKTDEYHSSGKHPIIDQGQEVIAGYTDLEDGLLENVPAIVFGDHTRIVKYIDKPFFLGADGVKVLRSKVGYTTHSRTSKFQIPGTIDILSGSKKRKFDIRALQHNRRL